MTFAIGLACLAIGVFLGASFARLRDAEERQAEQEADLRQREQWCELTEKILADRDAWRQRALDLDEDRAGIVAARRRRP